MTIAKQLIEKGKQEGFIQGEAKGEHNAFCMMAQRLFENGHTLGYV